MKITLVIALLILPFSVHAQTAPTPPGVPSMRDQIKADRAKSKADVDSGPKERPWDRDVNGERPWERKLAPSPKQ